MDEWALYLGSGIGAGEEGTSKLALAVGSGVFHAAVGQRPRVLAGC